MNTNRVAMKKYVYYRGYVIQRLDTHFVIKTHDGVFVDEVLNVNEGKKTIDEWMNAK